MLTMSQGPDGPTASAEPRRFRWTPTRVAGALGLFAFAASLWIHAVTALLAVLLSWFGSGSGVATGLGQGERGISLGPATSLSELAAGDPSTAPGSLLDRPLETAGAESSLTDVMGAIPDPTAASGGDPALAGGAGDSTVFSSAGAGGGAGGSGLEGGGGGGTAKFFGIEARGKRFVYICDHSGSMESDRLEALKRELTESINSLTSGSQFSIVFFSSDAQSITGASWMDAGPKGRDQVKKLLRGVVAMGGTEPLPGFRLAFEMRPRPDAIYFMTDGQFGEGREEQVVGAIRAMNNSGTRPCPIHCIAFIEQSGEKILKMIARSSGGVYRYVPGGSGLPPSPSGGGKP